MACGVDSPIAWSDVYELGQAIDQVAEDLNIPDYEKLVPDLRPFEYESVVNASFDQVFDLNPCGGTPLVTKAFINFTLTGHLKEMADAGALAFVMEPDDCLCKTIFVVVPVGGGDYSLEEFAQQGNRAVGCCQSLFVPKAGDLLDYGQHIIPAGYVATYIDRYAGFPVGEPPQTLTGPACTKGGPTISYEIRAANGCYGLQRVRRPMNGFFTWPIEKRVFNEMWDRLNQIVEESCGSDGSFKKADGGDTIAQYCPVTMEDVVYTIKDDGETFDSEPGGITLNLNLPWDSPTNGGEDCENHGPKVYCTTFQHLQAIIDKIALLEPYEESCPACESCNVIANSLCGTAPAPCGFPEFTDPEADPPVTASCPPKYYRTKTTVVTFSESTSDSGGRPGNCWTFTSNTSENYTKTEKMPDGTEDCAAYCSSADGTSIRNTSWSDGRYPPTSCSKVYSCSGWSGGGSCRPYIPWDSSSITTAQTTQTTIKAWSYNVAGSGCRHTSASASETITVTLSDEITLHDSLKELICAEERCTSEDDPPSANECRYCCTDRGGIREGLAYVDPLTPEGCIIPGSSGMAWEVTDCESPSSRSGQSSRLSLWFKDLIPGATYKATIYYKRCSFARNEDDEVIPPAGCIAGSCAEESSEEYQTITDEITFTATDWGEILSLDCGQCDIMFKKCELEDEANDWNTANPEETPRSVGCTSGGFDIPTSKDTYTWFHSCALAVVPPPE